MILIPGKLYKLKRSRWFYSTCDEFHDEADSYNKSPGTQTKWVETSREGETADFPFLLFLGEERLKGKKDLLPGTEHAKTLFIRHYFLMPDGLVRYSSYTPTPMGLVDRVDDYLENLFEQI